MTTTLIIVRHGQTSWNKDERFRGRTDLPLDETGKQQAENVARRTAAEYRPAAIFASPLQRTMQTAAAIARHHNLHVRPDGGLLDLDYGDFAGLSTAEAAIQFPEVSHTWQSAPHIARFPHGESLSDVRTRVTDLIYRAHGRFPNEHVVLISHLVVCRVLLCVLLGIADSHFFRFRVDTASLTVFELNRDQAILVTTNDSCHLSIL